MKNLYTFLGLICLGFFFSSCGQKGSPSKSIDVSLKGFAPAINPANYPGGIILFGTNGLHSFSTRMPSADSIQTLRLNPPYTWDMFAIGWDGTSPMTMSTAMKCGHKKILLGGTDNQLNINMSQANCSDPALTQADFLNGGDFKNLEIVNCLTLPFQGGVSYSADCNITSAPLAEISEPLSYRIGLMGYDTGKNSQVAPLMSDCYSFPASPGVLTASNLITPVRLPMGGPASRLLNILVSGYSGVDCSGKVIAKYNYPKSVPDSVNPYPSMVLPGSGSLPTRLFIAGNGLSGAETALKLQRPFLKCKNYLGTVINCTTDAQTTQSAVDEVRWPMYNLGGSPTGRIYQGGMGDDRRMHGIMGEVWRFLTYTGAALSGLGMVSCEDVSSKIGQTFKVLDPEDKTFHSLKISAGQKTIPSGYSGAGNLNELRFEVSDGTSPVNQIMEFNCALSRQKVGWYRTRKNETSNSNTEKNDLELFYDFTAQNSPSIANPVKAEVYTVRGKSNGEKNYQFIRLYQYSDYNYKLLYMRADYYSNTWNNSRVYASADMGSPTAVGGGDALKAWASVATNTNNNTDTSTSTGSSVCRDLTLDKLLNKELYSGCSTISNSYLELNSSTPILDSNASFNIAWLAGSGTGQCAGKSPMECALTSF